MTPPFRRTDRFTSDDEIVDSYVSDVETEEMVGTDDSFLAWEAITELVDTDPERAWRLVLAALARCAPHREYIIGAGPLEDLLVKEPRRFAERVADELFVNPRFRAAFAVIHFSTESITAEDADAFNDTLRSRGIASELVPAWRIAEPDDDEIPPLGPRGRMPGPSGAGNV